MRDQRRAHSRNRCFLRARIGFGTSRIECLVLDISRQGAKLALPHTMGTPPRVEFSIPPFDNKVKATVRWRSGGQIGVHFDDEMAFEEIDAARLISLGPAAQGDARKLPLKAPVRPTGFPARP